MIELVVSAWLAGNMMGVIHLGHAGSDEQCDGDGRRFVRVMQRLKKNRKYTWHIECNKTKVLHA